MVNRFLELSVLGVLLAACPPSSTTCGRGRCQAGACVDAITTYVSAQELENDWWCVVPSDGRHNCPLDVMLQSPVKSSVLICAGSQVEVKYTMDEGANVVVDGATQMLSRDAFQIDGAHVDGGTVVCHSGEVCSAGWFHSGEFLPTVSGRTASSTAMLTLPNGTPGEAYPLSETADSNGKKQPLGPLLPTGIDITVHLGGLVDAQ